MALLFDMETDAPVEIAAGRGDLRYSSAPTFAWDRGSMLLAGDKRISYARLFNEQPMIAGAVGWLLAQSIRVPLKVYRRTGDDSRERLRPSDHPLAAALAAPWDRGSPAQLVMALLGSLLVHGNTVSEIDNGARDTIRFDVSDWRFSVPIMPWRNTIAGWTLDDDDPSVRRTISSDNALHIALWSPLGPIGTSPLQQLGVTVNIEHAAQRHTQAMFRNGATPPSAVIASEQFIGQDLEVQLALLDQLRTDIAELYGGPDNSGKPAVMPPGLDWKSISHNATEARLIEQRHLDREEIGAVYHLQPGVLGIGLAESNTDLPSQRQASYQDGLAPPLILIEQCINAQIVRELLREDDVFVEHDFAGIMRGDRLKEIEALRAGIASALMTPNQGKAVLNLPRSDQPGMDEHYLPRNNLWPLSIPYPTTGMGATEKPSKK